MGSVYQPTYWKRMPDGTRQRVKTAAWYARWQVAGKTRKKRIGPRAAAVAALAKFEDAEARRRFNVPDPRAESAERNRPLAEFLALYLENLAARDTAAEHRKNVESQLTRVLHECRWRTFADIDPDRFTVFLGGLRDKPRPRPVVGAARKPGAAAHSRAVPARGLAPTTLNGYIRTAKAFTAWVARRLKADRPLRDVAPYPEEVDLRRAVHILTDAELGKVLAATTAAAGRRRSRGAIRGHDRAMLYRLAAFTGLRAGELAELTPAHFDLAAAPPVVTVEARDAKGKRAEPIPLPAHLVELLTPWLAGKPRHAKLFPGTWAKHKHASKWLRWDLGRAGISGADGKGRVVTFHSLKRRYVTRIIDAGAKVHEVRRLARHADVRTTLRHYTAEGLADLGILADKLPPV